MSTKPNVSPIPYGLADFVRVRTKDGNFERLRAILTAGEAHDPVIARFPVARVTEPQHFISLLYHLGLLTRGAVVSSAPTHLDIKILIYI